MKKLTVYEGQNQCKEIKKVTKRKRDKDDGVWEYYLKTRMTPKNLLTFINSNLSPEQIADVKAMGFGGLLTIKTDNVPGALAYWIVSRFNTCSSSLLDGQLQITDEDVHLATGIPLGSTEVQIASRCDKNEDFNELKREWLTQFKGNPTKVETKDILNLIISQRDGGEKFQRNFIVFIVSAFLMGVKGTFASLRVLKCLRDISSVKSLNWCGFARRSFIEGVESWKTSKNDFFSGPIMVFVMIYLDRVVFKYYSVPRLFPTLASWTKEAITNRLKCEQVEGFGTGGIQPRILKDNVKEAYFCGSSNDKQTLLEQNEKPGEKQGGETKDENQKEESQKKSNSTVKKLAECANNLAIAYEQFSETLSAAALDCPENKIVRQMAQMAEALNECSYSSQPDSEVKGKQKDKEGESDSYPDACREFAQLEFETEEELFAALVKLETALGKRPEQSKEKDSRSPIVVASKANDSSNSILLESESQEMQTFNFEKNEKASEVSPATQLIISESEEQDVVKLSDVSPATKLIISESQGDDVIIPAEVSPICSIPPGDDVVKPAATTTTKRKRVTRSSPGSFTPPSFKLIRSESQDDDGEKVSNDNVIKPIEVSPISSFPPKSRAVITRATRNKVETEVFRSPFLNRNIRLHGSLSKIEKEVLEHVFSESFDESEILFQNDEDKLTRRNLKTLLSGDKVPESLIHTWCYILNKRERSKSRESPSRLFLLQTTNADKHYELDDNFTAASLIFVPVISQKPFAFCFNFLTSKLEILHLMTPKSVEYSSAIKSTQEYVIKCLKKKMPSIDKVLNQITEEYVPKSVLGDGIDSGIYLMRLLETYKGTRKGFAIGLQDSNQVKVYGARICFEILSFNGNHLKDKVLHDAASFSLDIRSEFGDQEIQKAQKPQRKLTDTEIFGLIINSNKDKSYLGEIVIDTKWTQANRAELRTLKGRAWLVDVVIDLFGIKSTYQRQDVLYLPTSVKYADTKKYKNPHKNNIIWCPHVNMSYKPESGDTIDKVFFPIGDGKHWFACVSDLKTKKNYILDSIRPKSSDLEEYNSHVEDLIHGVATQMNERNGYGRLKIITMFETVNVDVPQQPNTFDCGLYVLKFLEGAINDTNLWTNKNHFKNLIGYRRQVLLQLLKWDENTIKVPSSSTRSWVKISP